MTTTTIITLTIQLTHISDDVYRLRLTRDDPASGVTNNPLGEIGPEVTIPSQAPIGLALNAEAYGQWLGEMLLEDSKVNSAITAVLDEAESKGTLRIVLDLPARLQALAWEGLHLPGIGAVATRERIRLSRFMASAANRPVSRRVPDPVRVLTTVASPSDLVRYNLPLPDKQSFLAMPYESLPTAQVSESNGTLSGIKAGLKRGIDVFCLVCHGKSSRDGPYLLLENEQDRKADLVAAKELADLINDLDEQPRLVVLVSCYGAGETDADHTAAVGPLLVHAGIAAVIAMRGAFSVISALKMLPELLSELVRDGSVERALAAARWEIRHRHDAWLPVLYSRLRDGFLWMEQTAVPELPPPALYAPSQDVESIAHHIPRLLDLNAHRLREYVEAFSGLIFPIEVYSQIASALNYGKHVLLTGPPGTGKVNLAQAIGEYVVQQQMSCGLTLTEAAANWTASDTIGEYVPDQTQTFLFRPGLFIEAIRQGNWLIIAEMHRTKPDIVFGELLSVLAGRTTTLPFHVNRASMKVIPPHERLGETDEEYLQAWLKVTRNTNDYVVHPNWRIIGTLNRFNDSYLAAITSDVSRHFVSISIEIPAPAVYRQLLEYWLHPLALEDEHEQQTLLVLNRLIDEKSPLMRYRPIGPALIREMIRYLGARLMQESINSRIEKILPEALSLHIVPQLIGLDPQAIFEIYTQVSAILELSPQQSLANLQSRIRALYPHIRPESWAN